MPKKILVIIIFFFFSSALQAEEFKLKKIVNLDKPWGSSFINENEIIITEKKGKIKIININSNEIFEITHNLNFIVHGQGGLLDILFNDTVGIGEHIDLVTEVRTLVETITEAEDNLDVVSRKMQEYSNRSLGHFRDRTATLDEYYEGSQ